MIDQLSRIEPVARDLVEFADAALLGLGAPAGHPIWDQLRRLNATPGAVVDFFSGVDPGQLRSAAAALRALAEQVGRAGPVESVPWDGRAAEEFAARLTAVGGYLGGDWADAGEESLLGRLAATASYVEQIAEWYERSREWLAGTLAEVLTSAQAVTLRAGAAAVSQPEVAPDRVSVDVVLAAADIGARLLATAAQACAAGRRLAGGWDARLDELAYRDPAPPETGAAESTVRLRL